MFNIFSKKKPTPSLSIKKDVQVSNAIIQEIHNAFDIAGDKALTDAKKILGLAVSEHEIKRAQMLKSLGFTQTPDVKNEADRVAVANMAERRAETVQKYLVKYPHYKFIFEDQVKEICEKYGLLCGTAERYRGTIPDKNLAEIAAFKVSDEDTYVAERSWQTVHYYTLAYAKRRLQEYDERGKRQEDYTDYNSRPNFHNVPFYICAPEKDMDITNARKFGHMIKDVPDPIVLHFVKDGYLIVSKWGIEGEDPSLVNETMN
jgi:hypothetical protein